jgi:hypothetical protein
MTSKSEETWTLPVKDHAQAQRHLIARGALIECVLHRDKRVFSMFQEWLDKSGLAKAVFKFNKGGVPIVVEK